MRSSHSVHPLSVQLSAPSCASISWKNVLDWTTQMTVFLKTKTIFKKDNNYHSKIFYLDPIAQVVWITGNRQLAGSMWKALLHKKKLAWNPEKPIYDCFLSPTLLLIEN